MKYKIAKLITPCAITLIVISALTASSFGLIQTTTPNTPTTKITVFQTNFIPTTTVKVETITAVKVPITTMSTTTAKKTTVQKKSSKKTATSKKKVKERYQIIKGFAPPKNVNTSFKSYMSYRAITCINSNQYILQQKAHTDKNGIRRVGNDVCIALGTRYSSTVGERFLIELDTGQRFTAIVGDIKSDAHTDKKTHSYIEQNGNVVEFIVDDKKISNNIKFTGDVSCIDKYKGQIKAIVRIA